MSAPPPDAPKAIPIKVFRLGDEPSEDLSATTTAEERVEMVWTLSKRMWELTGRPFPTLARHELPVRIYRRT